MFYTGVLIRPLPDLERNKLRRTNSNFCKSLKKKKFGKLSVLPGLRGSNDLRVGRKMATFQLFFHLGRAKDLSATLYEILITKIIVSITFVVSFLCFYVSYRLCNYTEWHKKKGTFEKPNKNWGNPRKKNLFTEIEPLQLAF